MSNLPGHKRGNLSPGEIARAVKAYREGVGLHALSDRYHLSRGRMKALLMGAGVKIRTTGEARESRHGL